MLFAVDLSAYKLGFYAFDDNFAVSKRKRGVEFQKNPRVEIASSTGGIPEFHRWKSRVPLLEVESSTTGTQLCGF